MKEALVNIGFTKYEADAYMTLIESGQLTAGELSKLSKIPQGRIYHILGRLEQKGFCSIILGAVKTYKAIHPKTAFSGLIQAQNQAVENLKGLQHQLETVYNEENHHSPTDYIQVLTSKQGQVEKFDDLINLSSQTLFSFNKKPYATGFNRNSVEIKAASQPLVETLKRGTKVKALFEGETGENKAPFIEMIRYYESLGETVRICDKLPLKMLLADQNIAMVSLRNNDKNKFKLTSMVVEHSDLTNALSELFDLYWEKSLSIEDYYKQQL